MEVVAVRMSDAPSFQSSTFATPHGHERIGGNTAESSTYQRSLPSEGDGLTACLASSTHPHLSRPVAETLTPSWLGCSAVGPGETTCRPTPCAALG
jgi:hypothetical protein